MRGRVRRILMVVLLVFSFVLSGFTNAAVVAADEEDELSRELQLLGEIIEMIDHNFVEEVDREKMLRGAIKGLLEALEDPYTNYLTPEDYEDLQIQTRGTFSGIGIEVTPDEDEVVVVSPIKGTPGEKAGLRTGDRIVKVDGEPTADMDFRQAVGKMRGEEGTKVELTIVREDDEEPLVLEIERAFIEIPNVTSEMKREGLAYIRLNTFNEGTGRELREEIGKFEEQGLKGIVLDLRSNPGGILPEAVAVASNFVAEGSIVDIKNRYGVERSLEPDTGIEAVDYPLVVLVNLGSASASEIVAGAIQDYSRGIVVGTQTFGKGSVQNVVPLREGALSLTVARYYTPAGRSIHEKGIEPDIVVEPEETEEDAEEEDRQLEKALDLLEILERMLRNNEQELEEIEPAA